jgi:hypothetical protein
VQVFEDHDSWKVSPRDVRDMRGCSGGDEKLVIREAEGSSTHSGARNLLSGKVQRFHTVAGLQIDTLFFSEYFGCSYD